MACCPSDMGHTLASPGRICVSCFCIPCRLLSPALAGLPLHQIGPNPWLRASLQTLPRHLRALSSLDEFLEKSQNVSPDFVAWQVVLVLTPNQVCCRWLKMLPFWRQLGVAFGDCLAASW